MLLLVDLDGVVYRATEAVPGVPEVLAARAALGDIVVYVTNNAMHHRSDYVPRLQAHGAPVSIERVMTSARASALYLRDRLPGVRRVLAVGAAGLVRELGEVGLDVIPIGEAAARMDAEGIDGWEAAGHPDAVVAGLDQEMTYLRIAAAADCVRHGAPFVATNRDPMLPYERGFWPGAGTIVAAIEAASRTQAIASIGKPAPFLLEEGAAAVGGDLATAVMIGDSVTDIAAGKAVGARTILVLTGVTTRAMADALPDEQRPTRVCADADDLATALEELALP